MKILVDMNLSPAWVPALNAAGHEAIHWTAVGKPNAPDRELFAWARMHEHIVFTHDLDFGAILAATKAEGPSVVQLRMQDISPELSAKILMRVLSQFQEALTSGALISLDPRGARARLLPL